MSPPVVSFAALVLRGIEARQLAAEHGCDDPAEHWHEAGNFMEGAPDRFMGALVIAYRGRRTYATTGQQQAMLRAAGVWGVRENPGASVAVIIGRSRCAAA